MYVTLFCRKGQFILSDMQILSYYKYFTIAVCRKKIEHFKPIFRKSLIFAYSSIIDSKMIAGIPFEST